MAKKCISCCAIPSWSFDENIVAYCPFTQKYVTKDDGCEGIIKSEAPKKAAPKKAATKKAAPKKTADK